MTPSENELYERAEEFRDLLDEMDEASGLTSLESRLRTFMEDVMCELEGA